MMTFAVKIICAILAGLPLAAGLGSRYSKLSTKQDAQKTAVVQQAALPVQPAAASTSFIPVDNELEYMPVTLQKNCDCGLHAVLNALWAERQTNHAMAANSFAQAIKHTENRNRIEKLRHLLRAHNPKIFDAYGNINGDGVIHLMNTVQLSHLDTIVTRNQKAPSSIGWTMIDNSGSSQDIVMSTAALLPSGTPISQALTHLRTQPNGSHLFILCNTTYEQNDQATTVKKKWKRDNGHWITVLVQNQNNKRRYTVFDSLSGDSTTQVDALQNMIETWDVGYARTLEAQCKKTVN